MKKSFRIIGLGIVFLWFMGGGISHFTHVEFFLHIMPPYIPFHLAAVYLSGALEILLAFGILHPKTRPWAGNLLILLVIAVTPANIYMWMNPHLFPEVSPAMLSLRLVVQVLLLALIWWSTRRDVPGLSPDGSIDGSNR